MRIHNHLIISFSISVAALFSGCSKDNDNVVTTTPGGETSLTAGPNTINLSKEKNFSTFQIFSNKAWTATSDGGWLNLSVAKGAYDGIITVNAEQNTGLIRYAKVTVSATGADPAIVNVTQAGPLLFSDKDVSNLSCAEGSFSITINTPEKWNLVRNNYFWYEQGSATLSGTGSKTINYTYYSNCGSWSSPNIGSLVITTESGNAYSLTIRQSD